MNVLYLPAGISVPSDVLIFRGAFNALVPPLVTGWHPTHAAAKVSSVTAGRPIWIVDSVEF